MTESSTRDLWGIVDKIPDLVAADGPGEEASGEMLYDPEWLRERLLALRHLDREISELVAQFDAERVRLNEAEQHMVDPLVAQAQRLTGQVTSLHRALIADAERRGVRPEYTKNTPQGVLKSRAGSTTVEVVDQAAAVKWLRSSGMGSMVKVPELPAPTVDRVAVRALIKDGRIVSPDGELCPPEVMRVSVADRNHWVVTE